MNGVNFNSSSIFEKNNQTIEFYGAVGDGLTDDSSAWNTALDNEDILYLSSKTYKIDRPIGLKSNKKIIGQFGTILKFGDIQDTTCIRGTNVSNLYLENIIFDFDIQTELKYGLSLFTSDNFEFKNCIFKNGYGYSVRLNDSCHDFKITNCKFLDIKGASSNPGGAIVGNNFYNVEISGCYCNNLYDHFLYVDGSTESYNINVHDCVLVNTGSDPGTDVTAGYAICFYSIVHHSILNNLIIQNCKSGIFLGIHGSNLTVPYQNSISNVIINNVNLSGITLTGSSTYPVRDIQIDGLIIGNSNQDGLIFRYAENIKLTNSYISSCVRNALELSGVNYSIFNELSFVNTKRLAMYLGYYENQTSNNNLFSNLLISPDSQSETLLYGIYLRRGSYNKFNNVTVKSGFPEDCDVTIVSPDNTFLNLDCDSCRSNTIYFETNITSSHKVFNIGDIKVNPSATSGDTVISMCTTSGNPGSWTSILKMP